MISKRLFIPCFIGILFTTLALLPQQEAKAQQVQVSFQVFYNNLSPYGTWINYPGYGYVWRPAVGAGFSPYATAGHWVWTEEGWLWASDYEWGWAPFHYGRWYLDDSYGWMWIPGEEWAPAWVSWRSCPGYYGWAPLYPGIHVIAAMGDSYYARRESWVFVQSEHIGDSDPSLYYGSRASNETLMQRSTPINRSSPTRSGRSRYIPGPDRGEVERYTGRPVQAVALHETGRPGQSYSGNAVNLYRPVISQHNAGAPAAPAQVSTLRDLHHSQNEAANQQHAAAQNSRSNPAISSGVRPQVQHPSAGAASSNAGQQGQQHNKIIHSSTHTSGAFPPGHAPHQAPVQRPMHTPPPLREPMRQQAMPARPEANPQPVQGMPRRPHS